MESIVKEMFLYRCENCGSAKFFNEDHGVTFYVDQCNGCQGWSYYEKIVVAKSNSLYGELLFFRVKEEKVKDGTEEG